MREETLARLKKETEVFEDDLRESEYQWTTGCLRMYSDLDLTTFDVAQAFFNLDSIDGPAGGIQRYLDPSEHGDCVVGYVMLDPRCNPLAVTHDVAVRGISDLPVEFFARELIDVKTEDEAKVFEFVSKWGIPYSPLRRMDSRAFASEEKRLIEAQRVTDSLWTLVTESLADALLAQGAEAFSEMQYPFSDYRERYDAIISGEESWSWRPGVFLESVISAREARLSIELMQRCTRTILDYVTGDYDPQSRLDPFDFDLGSALSILNSNRVHHGVIGTNPHAGRAAGTRGERGVGMLTSAIFTQMADTITLDAPWRRCANEDCGRVFKLKRSESKKQDRDSFYCCNACKEHQKHNRRKRYKNQRKQGRV